ncbi:MAG: SsrA-binding protein [Candidatus Aminicenantes bacterium RBG_19FT_COMBO_58_17]|jgi:SsrA-binding protein|nr:MAG: SsrA-binding protein [Candidatus Aminicenantes bacterium RBG_19FT_COMBO_58_17]
MKIVASNKKAYFNYEIIESLEAGIALLGSEVKSMREGRVSLKDSYAEIRNGEVFLLHMNISPYEQANIFNHEPLREKKLLLHRQEIKRLIGKIREKGYTLIPTKVLFNEKGRVKVEVSLAKGKRTYEKKRAIKERDLEREVRAELKKRLR